MTTRQHSSFAIVFILGLLAMLMPLSIDMYLPALPVISAQFGVPAGSTQMTLSTYILGFALGQLIYGPMADSFGRKPVVLGGTLVFAAAAVACALANTIDQLIVMRFFHGLAAAAASVVINALMRDIYPKEEFSRMMSFVMLVTTIAPPHWRVKYVPLGVVDTIYYGSVDGHQCAAGAGILVAGGWRCGVCGLRVDGVIQCDGGHS